MEPIFCFFLNKGAKILVTVWQILVLIAVAGENIENQRFGIWNEK